MEKTVSGITLLGLGPGEPDQLTREAWELLYSADEIYLRTRQHPTVIGLPNSVMIHSFDEMYENVDFLSKLVSFHFEIISIAKRIQ